MIGRRPTHKTGPSSLSHTHIHPPNTKKYRCSSTRGRTRTTSSTSTTASSATSPRGATATQGRPGPASRRPWMGGGSSACSATGRTVSGSQQWLFGVINGWMDAHQHTCVCVCVLVCIRLPIHSANPFTYLPSHIVPYKHTQKYPTVFDPDGHLRVLLGGPARLMQTKPPSDASLAALKALYDWRDRVRGWIQGMWMDDSACLTKSKLTHHTPHTQLFHPTTTPVRPPPRREPRVRLPRAAPPPRRHGAAPGL